MKRLALSLASALLMLQPVNAANSPAADLPDIGSPVDTTLTKSDEQQLGRMIVRGLRDQNQVLEDPEVKEYIQRLGERLAAQTGDDNQHFDYFVVRDAAVNAFALPGGFIGVNYGLILRTQSESELASVMAHETGHVRQRHIVRAYQAQSRNTLASTAALLAAILVGAAAHANGNAMMGAVAMSQGVALQQSMNFTRGEEAEADRVGIELLAGAGFDPNAMARFFETMARTEGVSESGPLDLLRNHPVTSDRIAEARARASQYPTPRLGAALGFELMRERLRVVSAAPEAPIAHYYSALAAHRRLSDAERYGQALALMRDGPSEAAVATLTELRNAHTEETAYSSALGQALLGAGHTEQALRQFERATKLFPRNVPLAVRYAQALMQANKPRLAHELLLDLFNNEEPTPEQIRLTALAASAAGDPGDAYYYMGEYHLSGGDLPLAMQQLELALAAPDLTSIQRQRFRARLEQERGWMRESQEQNRNRGSDGGEGRHMTGAG